MKSVSQSPRLNTLANGLQVFELLVDNPMSIRELSAASNLPRQTVYRLVTTLITEGWVDRQGDIYRASIRLWGLVASSFEFDDVRDTFGPVIRQLADTHGESVHLAIYDRGETVYIDKAEGSNPVGSYTQLGLRAPAYCVATGKLLLAHEDPTEVEKLVLNPLEKFTEQTVTTAKGLAEEFARVRENGYAVNRGEWRDGVAGVAVPIRSPLGEVVAALGFSGPRDRVLDRLDELVMALREATGSDRTDKPSFMR